MNPVVPSELQELIGKKREMVQRHAGMVEESDAARKLMAEIVAYDEVIRERTQEIIKMTAPMPVMRQESPHAAYMRCLQEWKRAREVMRVAQRDKRAALDLYKEYRNKKVVS